MKIEWESDDHSRRPKVSTVHGWLAKMRGTLLGNERLRSQGIREMREANAMRRYKEKQEARRKVSLGSVLRRKDKTGSSGVFGFFSSRPRSSRTTSRHWTSPRPSYRSRNSDNRSTPRRFASATLPQRGSRQQSYNSRSRPRR